MSAAAPTLSGPSTKTAALKSGGLIRCLGLLAFLVLAGPYALSIARSSSPFDQNGDLLGYDFFAFYYAGEMVNAGRAADLYDWTAQRNLQRSIVHAWDPTVESYVCPYLNPPHYGWLMSWITPLGYAGALTVWWTLGLAAFLGTLAIWQRWLNPLTWRTAVVLTIALPAFFQTFAGGQNTYFTVLILTAFCHLLIVRREWLAGLVLALLAYKFQLLAVPAIFLLITARWRALAGLMLGVGATFGISLFYFGPDVMTTYARFAGELPNLMQTNGFYAAKQHSWYGFFEVLSAGTWSVAALRGSVAILSMFSVGAMCFYVSRNSRSRRSPDAEPPGALARSLSIMLTATVLASPHLFQYDLLILAPAAVLWRHGECPSTARLRPAFSATVALVILWLSFANSAAALIGLQLTPLLLAGWLALVLRVEGANLFEHRTPEVS